MVKSQEMVIAGKYEWRNQYTWGRNYVNDYTGHQKTCSACFLSLVSSASFVSIPAVIKYHY